MAVWGSLLADHGALFMIGREMILLARYLLFPLLMVGSVVNFASAQLGAAAGPPAAADRLARLQKAAEHRTVMLAEFNELAGQIQETQQKLAAAAAEAQALAKNIEDARKQAFLIGQSIADLRSQRTRVRGSTAAIDAQLDGLRGQQDEYNNQAVRFQQQLAAANVVGQQLTARLRTEETAMKGLRGQAEKLKQEWLALIEPLGGRSKAENQALVDWLDPRLTVDPTDEGGLIARALAYRQLEQTDKAIADLDGVVRMQGVFTTLALSVRGGLLIAQGKEREGNLDYAEALKVTKTDYLMYAFRGLARAAKGQFAAAENDLKLAAQLGKGQSEGQRLLALFYATCPEKSRRDGRKALAAAKLAVTASGSKDWTCLDALAAAEAEMGNFPEAVKQIQAAADLATDENRQLCLDRRKLYEQQQPLRLDWK